mgnify:FL=1
MSRHEEIQKGPKDENLEDQKQRDLATVTAQLHSLEDEIAYADGRREELPPMKGEARDMQGLNFPHLRPDLEVSRKALENLKERYKEISGQDWPEKK